jgi:AcrR family transcriptional regulator
MNVSPQPKSFAGIGERGARARTARLMLETAVRMMQDGVVPSVSQVAEEAGVSRATAYRYFPSEAALVHAVVDEALGPILEWSSDEEDAESRVDDLIGTSLPRIEAFEATFRAALKHSLEQWAARRCGIAGLEPPFTRGHRIELLRKAIAPLHPALPEASLDRLAKALSLVFGVETLVILKDIWNVGANEAREVALWSGRALVRAAIDEARSDTSITGPTR